MAQWAALVCHKQSISYSYTTEPFLSVTTVFYCQKCHSYKHKGWRVLLNAALVMRRQKGSPIRGGGHPFWISLKNQNPHWRQTLTWTIVWQGHFITKQKAYLSISFMCQYMKLQREVPGTTTILLLLLCTICACFDQRRPVVQWFIIQLCIAYFLYKHELYKGNLCAGTGSIDHRNMPYLVRKASKHL